MPNSALTAYDEIKMIEEAIAIRDRQCAGGASARSAYLKAPESVNDSCSEVPSSFWISEIS
jgi:hypothetical protein